MKTISFVLVLTITLLSSIAFGGRLTYRDLVKRTELQPAQCQLTKSLSLPGGQVVNAGETFIILEFQPKEMILLLPDGTTSFAVSPDDTNVVSVAEANNKS